MSTNLPIPTQNNNSQKIAAVHASSIIDDNVNKIMPSTSIHLRHHL